MAIDAGLHALADLLGERVTTSTSVRAIHGRDESAHPERAPEAVVFPRSTDEVAAILRVCAAEQIPLIAFGAGTSLEGHVLAAHGGIAMDMGEMNKILAVHVEDLDVVVQPGVHRNALNEHLGRQGLFFSVDPGADATIGGMAATNASGTTTPRYGAMKQNVLALEVVLADGRVIRTGSRARKSSAGYDLTRLMVGSEGTLGIITELTLRAHGIPEQISAAVVSFPTIRNAVDTAIAIVQLGIPVARCELLDIRAMHAVNAYSNLGEIEAPTLFLEFHGTDVSVTEDARAAGEIAENHGGSSFRWSVAPAERARLWKARHEAFFAGRALRPGCRAIPTDAAVPVSRLADCIDETVAEMEVLPFPTKIVGHVADGNFHVAMMIDPDDQNERAEAAGFIERLSERARRMDGTCTGEHGIGIGKQDALIAEAGESVSVMRAIKQALDPLGILNPGKIFTA